MGGDQDEEADDIGHFGVATVGAVHKNVSELRLSMQIPSQRV